LTGPFLDLLTHHVNILEMNGDSYRLNQIMRVAANQKPRQNAEALEKAGLLIETQGA